MDHDQIVHNEIKLALMERRQQDLAAMVALHGGLDGWFAECRARKANDPGYQMARSILRFLRSGGDPGPLAGKAVDRARLATDPALNAFWQSVAQGGPEAWTEERLRIKAVEEEALQSADPEERMLGLDVNAVRSLLPIYRVWGRMLLDA